MEIINQPNKKFMFWFLTIINLIASILDLVLTYIGTPDLSSEANPLIYTFGLGWSSLIISSIIFFVVIMFLLYYAFFLFKRVVIQCDGFKQYISMLFFNRPDKFIWTLYKFPKNKVGLSYFTAGLGCVLALIIPIMKLFAIILWIGIIKEINIVHLYHNFFNITMLPFGRSDAFIGGIILFLFIWHYWFLKEYRINKRVLENRFKN
jgi:hypothetical protein